MNMNNWLIKDAHTVLGGDYDIYGRQIQTDSITSSMLCCTGWASFFHEKEIDWTCLLGFAGSSH